MVVHIIEVHDKLKLFSFMYIVSEIAWLLNMHSFRSSPGSSVHELKYEIYEHKAASEMQDLEARTVQRGGKKAGRIFFF